MLAGCPATLADPEEKWLYWQKMISSSSYQGQLRAVQIVHNGAVGVSLTVTPGRRPASV